MKCEKYWPEVGTAMEFGDLKITTTSEESVPEVPGLIKRRLEIQAGIGAYTHSVVQYHYMDWPDFGAPKNAKPLVDLVKMVRQDLSSLRGVCLVHCSAGVGRTGTMIALNKIIEDIEGGNQEIDIFNTVLDLRADRVLMVQSSRQYDFLHKCIDHFLGPIIEDKTIVEHTYVNIDELGFENIELEDAV